MSADERHGSDRSGGRTNDAAEEEARTRLFERRPSAREWIDHYTKADLYWLVTLLWEGDVEAAMQIWAARGRRSVSKETSIEQPTETDSSESNAS